jgi:hypothetical protein
LNNNGTSPQETPVVDQLILGQANATLPVFAGFKIKYCCTIISTKRKQQMLCNKRSSHASCCFRLYKAQKNSRVKEESKKHQATVTDFTL